MTGAADSPPAWPWLDLVVSDRHFSSAGLTSGRSVGSAISCRPSGSSESREYPGNRECALLPRQVAQKENQRRPYWVLDLVEGKSGGCGL